MRKTWSYLNTKGKKLVEVTRGGDIPSNAVPDKVKGHIRDLQKGGEISSDDRMKKADSSVTVASGKEERVGPCALSQSQETERVPI